MTSVSTAGTNINNTNTTPNAGRDYSFFHIKPFKDNERSVNHRDTILKNLVSLGKSKVTFIISGNMKNIKFFVKIPKEITHYFQNTFYANYPTSDLEEVDMPDFPKPQHHITYDKDAVISTKSSFTKDGTYMDPLTDILAMFSNIDKESTVTIYFTITYNIPTGLGAKMRKLTKKGWKLVTGAKKKKEKDDNDESEKKKKEEQQSIAKTDPDIFMSIRCGIDSPDPHMTASIKKSINSVFAAFNTKGKAEWKPKAPYIPMTYDQAINFFHIPTKANFIKGLNYTVYRKLPYPTNLPTEENTLDKNELTTFGKTDYRGEKVEFGIKKEDKFRHIYIVGKTGTGKSTFISNLVKSDMNADNGLCLIDPHGDLIDTVMEHIPTNRINDVILLDISDTEYPVGFNLLQYDTEDEKMRIVSGVVASFYKLFGHSWGPRLEYILRNVLLAIIEYPNATLMHILRMLVDKNFREEVLKHVKDQVVLKFWTNEFGKWNDKQREEAIGPITNKVGQFLSSNVVRNIFGQPRTKLNLRKAMDEGKILLVNLSKGKIGEDNASMIGSLIVTKFQIDAMSRADIPFNQRRDFYLYIDEFQNFATSSFATILSEARKYKLSLIVANQYTSQLLPEIRDAIFGNVGTIMSFTLGYDDAAVMTSQYKEVVSTNDLISLPRFTAYTKLMIDGITSDPFSMKTMPLDTPEGSVELMEKIRKQSRQRYAMSRVELENLLHARSNKTFSAQEKVVEKAHMEALGVTEKEFENIEQNFVQERLHQFSAFAIDNNQPDAIIFDTVNHAHKAVRYTKPDQIESTSYAKFHTGQTLNQGSKTIPIHVDMYQHGEIKIDNKHPLMIWIGTKDHIEKQLEDGYPNSDHLLFVPNIDKLKKAQGLTTAAENNTAQTKNISHAPSNFTIDDIKIGEQYEGYVKLAYNYGIFVTVKGVEGLLHKNFIANVPTGIDWKKYYNIGDKIKVKAAEFKNIKGEKKVVWTQK